MRKQLFLLILLSLVFSYTSFVSAAQAQDTLIDLKISTNLTPCYVTIAYPNTTNFIYNGSMDSRTGYANYTFNGSELGSYQYYSNCGNGFIDVTPNGEANADSNFSIFVYILFIISVVGLISTFILTLVKLATSNETIFGILTTWAFYILMIITDFLAKSYFNNPFLSNNTAFFLTITVWTNGVLPLISLFITFFVKGTQKKKPLGVEELTGRSPYG